MRTKGLKEGSVAPDFELLDQNKKPHKLSDYKGKWVLLYFYPKDNTPGCTVEAVTIRDNFPKFKKNKIVVIGISKDTSASHKKFEEKYELPFTLLVDKEKEIAKKYGVLGKKKFMGREYMGVNRFSFLISPDGKISKTYYNVLPAEHANEVLSDVKKLS